MNRNKTTFARFVAAAVAVMATAVVAGEWPLVTMRQMGSTTFSPETLRVMYEIHGRYKGAVDEFWLADEGARLQPVMTERARLIGSYAEASAKAGLIQGFQQGVTLGHDFSKRDETSWPLPDDAWQIDRNGNRSGFPCPRSPAVQAMEEAYAETYVREGKVKSFWLDDDLRLGFCKRGVESCWCPRCLKALNDRAGTSFTREEAVKRLSSGDAEDPLRKLWAETRAETLAEFAKAAARGARRADPKVRLAYQAISSATINSGEDNSAILAALSDGWKHSVGIRPGHGFYNEDADVKREIAAKVLDTAREAERCRALPQWRGSIVYEQENYPHHAMQKTMDAIVRESAVALAAGCDAVALYWYCANYPEPLSYYEELVADVALWRPYYMYLSDLALSTHLGGVSKARDPDLMTGPAAALQRMEGLVRRDPAEVALALMGVPVTVHEAGSTNHFDSAWVPRGHYLDKVRTDLLDRLDRGEAGGVCVRVDKNHPLLVYPRVDKTGRTVAATFVNVSIGTARALPVRVRRPVGKTAVWVRALGPKTPLVPAAGEGDELRLSLPDLQPWEVATLDLRKLGD